MWYTTGHTPFRGTSTKPCPKNKKTILGDYRNFDLNFHTKFNLFTKITSCTNRIFLKENIQLPHKPNFRLQYTFRGVSHPSNVAHPV